MMKIREKSFENEMFTEEMIQYKNRRLDKFANSILEQIH